MTSVDNFSIVLLRLGIGWVFFYAGYEKVVTFFTEAENWTAAGFLANLNGTFADLLSPLAGNLIVDYLNAYGLLLIGVALLLGILVRFAAFWGIIIMLLYYLASFPAEHSFIVEDHIIYALVLLALAALGAGRIWGLDKYIEQLGFVQNNSLIRKFLG